MFTPEKDYISISLNEGILKMAHLRGAEVIHVAARDVRSAPDDELVKVIQNVLAAFGLKRATAVYLVSSSAATTKNIEIPSRDPEEIKSIINLQAGRHTPYSREEILIGYMTIGVYQVNYTKVLLVIANRNVIRDQLKVFSDAGLSVEKVFFSPEGKAAFYSRALNLKDRAIPVGIIDISGAMTDFTIEFHGMVIASRNIPIGMAQMALDPQGARERLCAELQKSIESYTEEDIDKPPQTYILTVDDPKVKALQPALKEALGADVIVSPFWEQVKVAPNVQKLIAEHQDDSLLSVVSPARAVHDYHIDLMPEEMKLQKSLEDQGREVIKMGVFTVVMLVLVCAVFFTKIYFKSVFLNNLVNGYSKQRKEVEWLEAVSARSRIVKDYMNSRMMSLEVTNELYRIIPEEIYLDAINLNEEGTLSIKGTSESMSRVFSLVTALEDSILFKSVKTQSTTAKKERGKDVAAFEIVCKLESAKDDEATDDNDDKEDAKSDKKAESKDKSEAKSGSKS